MKKKQLLSAITAAAVCCSVMMPSALAGDTHIVQVTQGIGFTSDAVGTNTWSTSEQKNITYTPQIGYGLTGLSVQSRDDKGANYEAQTVTLRDKPSTITVGGVTYPLQYEGNSLTMTIPRFCEDDLILGASASGVSYSLTATADADINVSGGSSNAKAGELITLVATPQNMAQITRIQITREDAANTANIADGAVRVGGVSYPFTVSSGGVVSMKLNATENLQVHFYGTAGQPTEKYRCVLVKGGQGVAPERDKQFVLEGGNVNATATARSGWEITEVTVEMPDKTVWGRVDAGRIYLDGKEYRIDYTGQSVTLHLTDVRQDISVFFSAEEADSTDTGYDHNHSDCGSKRLTLDTSEGKGVRITRDSNRVIDRGDDVVFTIEPKAGYWLDTVTLRVGSESKTVNADASQIKVAGRPYDMEMDEDGIVTLTAYDVRDCLKVSAVADKDASSDKSYAVTTKRSDHCTVKLSTARVDKGDSVKLTVTPFNRYELDEVTLQIGASSKTVDADATEIKVGNRTYPMSLSASGVLTLTVNQVQSSVQVSATATETEKQNTGSSSNGQQPAGHLSLNKGGRTPYFIGQPENRFAPEAFLSRAEAVTMLSRLTSYQAGTAYPMGAPDVQTGAYYSGAVNAFYNAGILSDSSFRPSAEITRGELAVMLYRLDVGTASTGAYASSFHDVPINGELYDAVSYGASRGWIQGYADGTFRPTGRITRAETAKLINRATSRPQAQSTVITFADVPTSHWAYSEILSATTLV